MCDFYSFLTDKRGNRYAFTREMREGSLSKRSNLRIDSHASIAEHYFGDSKKEDLYNKFEFNPLTRKLKLDTMNLGFDDSELIDIDELLKEAQIAVPQLIIKPIINPFKDVKFEGDVDEKVLLLLKQWLSVKISIRYLTGDLLRDSVWISIMSSVVGALRHSSMDFIRGSASLSIWAYASSFLNIDNWKYVKHEIGTNPYQCMIDLWEMGLIPIYRGGVWQLHSHKGVIWEGRIE